MTRFGGNLIKSFGAIAIGIGLFFAVKPLIASATAPEVPLIDVPQTASVLVTNEGDQTIQITSQNLSTTLGVDNIPNVDPVIGNRYVVWGAQFDTGWQVMAYDLRAKKTLQLTTIDNNVHPITDGEYIAWESQKNGIWQVMLFDGTRFYQISDTALPAQNISLERNLLTYLQQSSDHDGWIGYIFDINTQTVTPLTPDNRKVASLKIKKGVLSWTDQDGHYSTRPTANAQYYPAPTAPFIPTPEVEEEQSIPTQVPSTASPEASSSATVTQEITQPVSPPPASSSAQPSQTVTPPTEPSETPSLTVTPTLHP